MFKIIWSFSAILAVTAAKPLLNSRTVETQSDDISYRLPNNTSPEHYDIWLQTWIDQGEFGFAGEVDITIDVIEENTNTITLHARQLTINEVHLVTVEDPDTALAIDDFTYDPTTEFLVIPLNGEQFLMRNNKYILTIFYNGTLREDDAGFYRGWYTDDDGIRIYLASTHFESTDARHAFPCYDEPAKKATFSISIQHSPTYDAISNMEILSSLVQEDGTVITIFNKTVKMSSYLIAFVVSNFKYKEDHTIFPHRIFAQPSLINETDFGLDAGVKILKAFENYFNYPFSLSKMDQIGLPQFGAGAMENWGLVTYSESSLFFNPAISETKQKHFISTIVAHEFSHQWFGNLVSPKWWSWIWLNEGFATLYEFKGADLAYPELRIRDYITVQIIQSSFNSDSLLTTTAMTTYAENPSAISSLFGNVAYYKSCSVLRMTEYFLTEEIFKKGLIKYLNLKAFSDAEADDLFNALDEAANEEVVKTLPEGVTVKTILDSWSFQKGYPIIEAHRLYDSANAIHITQARFISTTTVDEDGLTWWVPISIASANNPNFDETTPDLWVPQGTQELHFTRPEGFEYTNNDWIILNKQQTGYYRVNYDERNWLLIAKELVDGDYTKIHLLSRAQLLDDALDLGRLDRLDNKITMSIVNYLRNEVDYVPWAAADSGLVYLNRLLRNSEQSGYFKSFLLEISKKIYSEYGAMNKSTDTYFDIRARNFGIKWACANGNTDCLEETNAVMKTVISDGIQINVDLRSTLYCHGMRSADENDFNGMWAMFEAATSATDRNLIIDGISCNENKELLKQLVTNIFPTSATTSATATEKARVFSTIFVSSSIGLEAALEFLSENVDQVYTVYTASSTAMSSMLSSLASYLTTIAEQTKLNNILEELGDRISTNSVTTIKATVTENLVWVTANSEEVESFLLDLFEGVGDGDAGSVLSPSILIFFSLTISVMGLF